RRVIQPAFRAMWFDGNCTQTVIPTMTHDESSADRQSADEAGVVREVAREERSGLPGFGQRPSLHPARANAAPAMTISTTAIDAVQPADARRTANRSGNSAGQVDGSRS
ncbi:MAG: hypothetical protein ACR2Q4_14010, partial [Geminicoccaceae bacterium]